MAKKASRTKEQSDKQKRRTYANQVKKYTNLLAENPGSIHTKTWKKKLEDFSSK